MWLHPTLPFYGEGSPNSSPSCRWRGRMALRAMLIKSLTETVAIIAMQAQARTSVAMLRAKRRGSRC